MHELIAAAIVISLLLGYTFFIIRFLEGEMEGKKEFILGLIPGYYQV